MAGHCPVRIMRSPLQNRFAPLTLSFASSLSVGSCSIEPGHLRDDGAAGAAGAAFDADGSDGGAAGGGSASSEEGECTEARSRGVDAKTPPPCDSVATPPNEQPATTLVEAFADGNSACARDLEQTCSSNLERCATTPGCEDFAACVLDQATPAAPTTCGDLLDTTLEARWSYEDLRACWGERYQACSIGANWECLGGYNPPSTERASLTLSQTLTYFEQSALDADFDVLICGTLTDCSTPIARATTDAHGRYTVTLPIEVAPGRPGSAWRGYRRVDSPKIPSTRIEQNIPIWGDHVDVTRVLDSEQVELLQLLSGAARAEAVFIQVLDCRSSPAANVRLTLGNSESGSISYADSPRAATAPHGAAAAYDLEFDTQLRISAEWLSDGAESPVPVSEWRGSIHPGEVVYVKLYPEPR